ncbi:MAG: DUF1549 and DUF1553 domain-containing protein [Planctomycetales bacterium]
MPMQLVDRLLKSPHFGERWGRHWLDLAHYADSDGYEKDRARPDAYLYRDWVINAINQDQPFDQFTIEQLAGDLVPNSTARQKIATGFLRQTLTNEEGGVDQEEYRVAACFDRAETVGTVWLGLTVGCFRCHDHKYDPLPQKDYYRFFAFFNESDEVNDPLPIKAKSMPDLEQKLHPLETAPRRYVALAPKCAEWEAREHKQIMSLPDEPLKTRPVELASVTSRAQPDLKFVIQGEAVSLPLPGHRGCYHWCRQFRPAKPAPSPIAVEKFPERDAYRVTFRLKEDLRLTGFEVAVPQDERLPNKGPGLGKEGAFVLTGFQAYVWPAGTSPETASNPDNLKQAKPVELHRPKARRSDKKLSADNVLLNENSAEKQRAQRTGWGAHGDSDKENAIQFRTPTPQDFKAGQFFTVILSQEFGEHRLIGKFILTALVGDERGLNIPSDEIANFLEMYPEKRVAKTRKALFDYFVANVAKDEQSKSLKAQIAAIEKEQQAELMEIRTIGTPALPRRTNIFHRGEFLSKGDRVSAGTPAILSPLRVRERNANRLDLANWLVSRENALTPRVAVNHVWQHLFSQGIVRTPSDFGTRGEPPTHPELLDWLARKFQTDLKWSRKDLIRLIVSSAAYRQASIYRPDIETQDPRNLLVFRQNRYRIESEPVRDVHLAVAGLLSDKVGGPSVFPPMPDDLAKLSYANNFSWKNSEGEPRYRRGMYTFFKRTIPHPNLMTFDSPDANVACVARTVSDTPLQSLTLLNNEVHVEAAQAFAQRLLTTKFASDRDRLLFAVRTCIARPPVDHEVQTLDHVLKQGRDFYAAHKDQAAELIKQHPPKDVDPAEGAAWVSVARVLLNLDELVTRE